MSIQTDSQYPILTQIINEVQGLKDAYTGAIQGSADAEVTGARGGFPLLNNRLDNSDALLALKADTSYVDEKIQDIAYVSNGDLTKFKNSIGSSRTIILDGNFIIDEVIAITNVSSLTIIGVGATINVTGNAQILVENCTKVKFESIQITDSANAPCNPLFALHTCSWCSIERVTYNGVYPARTFCKISTGSIHCMVTQCAIDMVSAGVTLGDNGDNSSPYIEPAGNPTRNCVVSYNRISNYRIVGVSTRTRYNYYLDINEADARIMHKILHNIVRDPNPLNDYATNVGIESWGDYCDILYNKLFSSAIYTSHIGISLAKAFYVNCKNNYIVGAFNYQGIELATCNDCMIEGNRITGVQSGDANSAGIGISTAVVGDPASSNNLIKGNIIKNCTRGILVSDNSKAIFTRIIANKITECLSSGINGAGSLFFAQNNDLINNPIHINLFGGSITDRPIEIMNNYMENSSNYAIKTENGTGVGRPIIVKNNYFYGWYLCAIMLKAGMSQICNNTFKSDSRDQTGWQIPMCGISKSYGYGAVKHIVKDNVCTDVPLTLAGIVNDYVALGLINYQSYYNNPDLLSYENGKSVLYPASSAPVAGTWLVGDKIYNSSPAAAGYEGWICTAAGAPGTWKGFGLIQA